MSDSPSFSPTRGMAPWRVAAVFVTMNRSEVAATCVRKLAAQTLPPWAIVVVDNASSDNTVELLEGLSKEVASLEWSSSEKNLGNAGGVQLAMDRAFANGADAVWVLDDDSWPEPEALEQLLSAVPSTRAVLASLVLCPDRDELSWPIQLPGDAANWVLEAHPQLDHLAIDGWMKVRRAWLGALIPREIYDQVGSVEGRLFLRGEDEDYPRRIEHAGYPVWLSVNSILRHPFGGQLSQLKLGQYSIALERGLTGDKLYYRIRNMLWIKSRESGAASAFFLGLGYLLLLGKDFLRHPSLFGIFLQASFHALQGRLGSRAEAAS